MNIWYAFLYWIYSGIALGGLCAGKANELTQGLYNPDNQDAEDERRRMLALDRIVMTAQKLGDIMAQSTTMTLVGNYNTQLINTYEQSKQREAAALAAMPPANAKGS